MYIYSELFFKERAIMKRTRKTVSLLVWNVMVYAVLLGILSGARIVKAVQFDMNCTQYLKRAADANTVATAKEELGKAIAYAEQEHLTEGVVSIFLHQPSNDIGYWYKNMTEAYEELDSLPEDASSLETTNVLMKLRETLTDQKDSGVKVTVPNGISIYPYNRRYFVGGLTLLIFCIVCWLIDLKLRD